MNNRIDSQFLTEKLINAGIEANEAKKEISILLDELTDVYKIDEIINERIKFRTPIQYLLGKAYFMDFEVKVNNNVLIPRPETELLVEETVKKIKKIMFSQFSALDVGTGSGIIPVALAKLIPELEITGIDIEKDIIELAAYNAQINNVCENIKFKICDLFSKSFEDLLAINKFDLIISNPPYVKENELKNLKPEVYLHEPKIALCGSRENKTGLIYYERIFQLINKRSNIKLLAFEIDPPLVKNLIKILEKYTLNKFELVKDYSKLDRFLFVYLN